MIKDLSVELVETIKCHKLTLKGITIEDKYLFVFFKVNMKTLTGLVINNIIETLKDNLTAINTLDYIILDTKKGLNLQFIVSLV